MYPVWSIEGSSREAKFPGLTLENMDFCASHTQRFVKGFITGVHVMNAWESFVG